MFPLTGQEMGELKGHKQKLFNQISRRAVAIRWSTGFKVSLRRHSNPSSQVYLSGRRNQRTCEARLQQEDTTQNRRKHVSVSSPLVCVCVCDPPVQWDKPAAVTCVYLHSRDKVKKVGRPTLHVICVHGLFFFGCI